MKKIRLFFAAALLMAAPAAHAQTFEAEIGTDLVSHYIWRGQELGQVSIQPTLGISAWGLSLSAWGSVGLSNPADTKELDLTLAYGIGGFHIGVSDYWFNSGLCCEFYCRFNYRLLSGVLNFSHSCLVYYIKHDCIDIDDCRRNGKQ